MAAVTISSDFGAQENKSVTVSIVSPSIYHEVMGLDAMILVFWMLSFNPMNSLNMVYYYLFFPTVNSAFVLSHFSRVWVFVTLWTVALQAPLSLEFSIPEH